MRRIVMFNSVSADGYFAGADGNLDWVVHDSELDGGVAGSLGGSDTRLFGRKTYDMFESYWPTAVDEAPHAKGVRSPEIKAMGVWINNANKIVFSKSRKEVTWKNSRLVKEFDPREIEAIKQQPGKSIMVFGSGTLVSQLTQHGLIDEYQFIVSPVILGSGKSLINGVPKLARLKLEDSKTFRTGVVMLRYSRASQ